MPKFRKKPVIVEASQWFPDKEIKGVFPSDPGIYGPYVVTIHGQKTFLALGDWVITEPDGIHHYPCKPDIFDKTYEPVEESEQ